MATQLTTFRAELLPRLLDLAWSQWTTLGVSGRSPIWKGSTIDPDALLLFSCTMGRYDARLFDAILEWLRINGRFNSIPRLKRMLKEETFAGERILLAMVDVASTSENSARWARMTRAGRKRSKKEPLFFSKDGAPLPVVREPEPGFARHGFLRDRFESRDIAGSFRPELPSNLLLRLRALLGVNARCEIFQFLLLNGHGSPRALAKDCYYYPATISKALAEMSQSGFVISRTEGRNRFYTLVPKTWQELFLGSGPAMAWIVWPRLFSALEQLWLFLDESDLTDQSELAQASALRRILKRSVASQLNRSGSNLMFGDDSAHPAEALIPFFVDQVRNVVDSVTALSQ